MLGQEMPSEFFLTQDESNFTTVCHTPRWVSISLGSQPSLGLALPAGEILVSPELCFGIDTVLLGDLTPGRARVLFRATEDEELLGLHVGGAVELDLNALEGRTGSICICADDEIVVTKFVIGRRDRAGLLSARAHRELRVTNERRHFETVYDHAMYDARGAHSGTAAFETPPRGIAIQTPLACVGDDLARLPCAALRPGEDAFHYAHRVLGEIIGDSGPDFAERLRSLYKERPVRLLSLCSGTAGIERGLLKAAGIPVEITLLDINERLLGQAAAAVAPFARVFGVVGDVNALSTEQFAERFDAVLCVSGLHHVVELEHVLRTVSALLEDNGELWLIGEQIGRDGNRLWPEAREVADRLFAELPAPFRRNAHTGKADRTLPDNDFSAATFEGIRSSEIEPLLLQHFEPVQIYRRNCFLWRMMDSTYSTNYEPSNDAHRRIVLRLVAAEYNLWRDGGRPTEMHAVYQRR